MRLAVAIYHAHLPEDAQNMAKCAGAAKKSSRQTITDLIKAPVQLDMPVGTTCASFTYLRLPFPMSMCAGHYSWSTPQHPRTGPKTRSGLTKSSALQCCFRAPSRLYCRHSPRCAPVGGCDAGEHPHRPPRSHAPLAPPCCPGSRSPRH